MKHQSLKNRGLENQRKSKPQVSEQYGEPSSSNDNITSKCEILVIDENHEPANKAKRTKIISSSHENSSSESDSEENKEECVRACENVRKDVQFREYVGSIFPKYSKNLVKTPHGYDILTVDTFEHIALLLSVVDQTNLLFVNKRTLDNFSQSVTVLNRYNLEVDYLNFDRFFKHKALRSVPIKNASIDLRGFTNYSNVYKLITFFKSSLEKLHIQNAKFRNFKEYSQFLSALKSLKSLKFVNCSVDCVGNDFLSILPSLEFISLDKCNDNMFRTFLGQNTLLKIEVVNKDWTWNGFPHDIFNAICKNCKNLEEIVLNGAGTGSFFDSDEFSFKILKLTTSMITFHWYVGIRTERVSFLRSQIGSLKHLSIDQLPNDFDGGRVMKFIFEKMKLESFHYGKIALIEQGKKQNVKEFSGTEIQIKAAMELIEQFPSITSYCLILSSTDVASDEIEKAINPRNSLFHQIRKLEIIDNSRYRGLFGVFLGLLKNLINLEVLILNTQDRNINVLLDESLPYMTDLKELYLPSMASRGKERLNIIRSKAPTLQKLSIADQFVDEARNIFGKNFDICGIKC